MRWQFLWGQDLNLICCLAFCIQHTGLGLTAITKWCQTAQCTSTLFNLGWTWPHNLKMDVNFKKAALSSPVTLIWSPMLFLFWEQLITPSYRDVARSNILSPWVSLATFDIFCKCALCSSWSTENYWKEGILHRSGFLDLRGYLTWVVCDLHFSTAPGWHWYNPQ